MKKKTIPALAVLVISIIFITVCVLLIPGRFADQTPHTSASSSSPDDSDAISELLQHDTETNDISAPADCSHILSADWTSEGGYHFHTCVMPDCEYTDKKEACSGGSADCANPAVCQICGASYGTTSDHLWSDEPDYADTDGHAQTCTFGCGQHSELQPHTPGPDATEQSPQVCLDCGFVITDTIAHVHTLCIKEAQNADCTTYGTVTYYVCTGCSKLFFDETASEEISDLTSIRIAPLGHDFAPATCTNAAACRRSGCNATKGQPLGHSPKANWESDASTHWHICSTCGERTNHTAHVPGSSSTEQSAQTCTVCGYILNDSLTHSHKYDTVFKSDANTHWYECTCGQIKDKQNHTDTNKNGKCDICGSPVAVQSSSAPAKETFTDEKDKMESILRPAQITLLRPTASGILTKAVDSAVIDYSNTKDGYVMVKFTESTTSKLKVQVQGPGTTYTYNISPFEWTVFPLSDGSGNYTVKVFKNVTDNRYSPVLSVEFNAALSDEFAPFLRPNQYVNYENAINTMNKAAELVAGKSDTLEKVRAIYTYIITNITYDYTKAATVKSGYLPNLDQVLAEKKGICFDYAALMAGMLRSQNIACKLVIGYADTTYHAWISVWTPDKGWIDSAIFFDGIKWQMMDPTFAASAGSEIVSKTNYTSKYIY